MTRKHICFYQPTCCGNCPDPNTDTSTDFWPRHKSCLRKRPPVCPVDTCPPRLSKHKELKPRSKHSYSCFHVPQYHSRLSAERSAPALYCNNKSQNSCVYDDSSTDVRSVSSISQCASALSVDVSCEMAAVNQELDALLSRYERTLGRGARKLPSAPRTRDLQQRLMPRPPSLLRENLAASKLTGSKFFQPNEPKTTSTQVPRSRSTKVSPPPIELQESESLEMLKSMWEEMRQQGVIPNNEEIGKNIKKIYTKMKFDDSSELKIDIDGLSSMAKSVLSTEKNIPKSQVFLSKKSSVSTQTISEQLLTNIPSYKNFPLSFRGDGDKINSSSDKRFKMWLSQGQKDSETSKINSGEGDIPLLKNTSQMCNGLLQPGNISAPPVHRQTTLYNTHTSFEALKTLKSMKDMALGNEIKTNSFTKSQTENINLEKKYQLRNQLWQNTISQSLGRLNNSLNYQDYLSANRFSESDRNYSSSECKQINGNSDTPNKSKSNELKSPELSSILNSKVHEGLDETTGTKYENYSESTFPSQTVFNLQYQIEIPSENSCATYNTRDDFRRVNLRPVANLQNLASKESSNMDEGMKPFCSYIKENNADSEPAEDQNVCNESIDIEKTKVTGLNDSKLSISSKKIDTPEGLSNSDLTQTAKEDNSAVEDESKKCNEDEGSFEPKKVFSNENQSENIYMKEAMKKENLEKLDPSLYGEVIKRVTETMIKYDPLQETDEMCPGTGLIYKLRQLRSNILKIIQTEVKHIEDLDRCLEDAWKQGPLLQARLQTDK